MILVMSESKRKVLLSYRDQVLAVPLYSSAKRAAYYSEDFLELDSLVFIMNEVLSGESDITVQGKKFIKEFFGHENLAHKLIKSSQFRFNYSEQQLAEYFAKMEPNEIGNFIRECRNKSKKN